MFQTLEYEGNSHRAVSRSFGVVSKRATPFAPGTDREELRKNGRRITSDAPSGTPSALRNRSWGDDKEESRVSRAVASELTAASWAAKQVLGLRNLLVEIFQGARIEIPCMYGDNRAANLLASNQASMRNHRHLPQ